MNCIKVIDPIESSQPTDRDFLLAALADLGASVSNMPEELEGQETYSNNFELFDPEKVRKCDVDDLPDYWLKVWNKHNEPDMRDCRDLRYRYVHAPVNILPEYPRVPCKGIFCLDSREVRSNKITANDLIFVGEEFL